MHDLRQLRAFQVRLIAVAAALFTLASPAAEAGDLGYLGWSRVGANDSIGEFRDRWQTSAVQASVFFGPRGAPPGAAAFGDILEVRLRSQIITPENLTAPLPDDRLFVGALALDLFSHGRIGGFEASLGGGLVAVGEQTGTFRLQRWLHEKLGYPLPNPDGHEIANGVHGTLTAEIGRSFGDALRVRPFAEAQAGVETLVRAGVDLTWGALGRDDLMTREPVTGHRTPGLAGPEGDGLSFVAGADAAWVAESIYLPESRGYEALPRGRLRAGVHWQGKRGALFYGLTYLTPEFEGQREGQFLGAVNFNIVF